MLNPQTRPTSIELSPCVSICLFSTWVKYKSVIHFGIIILQVKNLYSAIQLLWDFVAQCKILLLWQNKILWILGH